MARSDDNDIEMNLEANIEVNGVNSVNKGADGFEKMALNASAAEKQVKDLSKAIAKLNQEIQKTSANNSNWYTFNKGFQTNFNTPVQEYGKEDFSRQREQAQEKIRAAQEEEARIQQLRVEEQRKVLDALQKQDLGRTVLLIGASEEAIKEGNKVLQREQEEQIRAAKKARKASELTANQKEKYAQQEKDRVLAEKRLEEQRLERLRKEANDNSGYNQFKNAHPELFSQRGGQYYNPKYQAAGALTSVGAKASQLGTGGRVIGDILQTIGSFVRSPIAGTATLLTKFANAIIDVGQAATQAFAEIESIKTQLGVVFSSQTQADSMFGEISEYAVHSPFGVQQTSELAVLLKQSGVYASDLMNTLKMLGDTAGGNMEKMKRIANNYAQIVSIGKASMLDMRQFAYAGIPIFEAVSKELKVSQQELRKMISDGKVTSDIIAKVFKDLTGINGIFENATEKGAKTLKARLQNLQDAKQLMLSEMGERIVNAGSIHGNDSPYLKLLSTAENFFQWYKEHNSIKNIERDVNLISKNKTNVENLQEVYEYAKKTGDKNLEKMAKAQLEAAKNLWGFDKSRNILSSSYDVKNKERLKYEEKYGEMSEEEIKKLRNQYYAQLEDISHEYYKEDIDENRKKQIERETSLINDVIFELNEFADALKKARKTTTEEEIKANREKTLLNTQQEAYDTINTFSDSSSSLMSKFQEINELYKASDEYKEKKERENQEALKEALGYLKEIAQHTDDKGVVDISSYSPSQFVELVQKGAFGAINKLDVVNGDKPTATRAELEKQYGGFQSKFEEFISQTALKSVFSDSYVADKFKFLNIGLKSRFTDEEFYDQFSKWYEDYDANLKKAAEDYARNQRTALEKRLLYMPAASQSEERQKVEDNIKDFTASIDTFRQALQYSLNRIETGPLEGTNLSEDDLTALKNAFIPLWKRIFATNTGLSTQGMSTPQKTLDAYLGDVTNRRTVSSVMKATLETLGVDAATSLLKPSNRAMELLGTEGSGRFIYQADWKKSRDALKDFAKQLSASTEIVSAYRQSLEDELEVLNNLIVQGATEMESQDLEKQKLVTVKQLQKLSEAGMSETASQLVNALGNKLVTVDNLEVAFRDGKFYDSEGNEVAEEQLKITDDIYEYIKTLLPEIKTEISRSKVAERNNQEMATWIEKVLPNELSKMVMGVATSEQTDISRYLHENTDYLTDQFNNSFDIVLERFKKYGVYDETTALGKENIVAQYLSGNKQAEAIVKAVIREVIGSAESLGVGTSGSTFQRLIEESLTTERDTAARDRLLKLLGSDTYYQKNPNARLDNGGYSLGSKILSDAFGVSKAYTMKDLYAAYDGEIDDTIKKTIRWTEALEDVKDALWTIGEETAKLSGDLVKRSWLTPFEQWGETQMKVWSGMLSAEKQSEEYTKNTAKAYKELGTEALNTLGPIMAKAGFELVARGAIDGNWALIAGGLGLAALGGFATGIGNALTEKQDDSSKDEAEKLQDLKDQLADLLEQARKDALYYENNMRHKTALGINKEFSYKSVNDAVITPQGDVITTDPKDYLIATKTPEQFANNGTVVTPIINCNVVNNSSAKVRQEQQTNADGSIDILTIIEDTVSNFIASSKSDDAFNARDYRVHGRQSIMS